MREKGVLLHYAWIILAVCFANLFINYGIRLGYSVALPEMIRTIGFTRRQGGDIFNAYFVLYACLSPFTGYLTDRLGARRVISGFGLALGGGALLMGTTSTFWQGILFFGLTGVGGAAMWTPVITVCQRWFAAKKKGMALGILSAGFGLGFAVMGWLFPIIVRHWSWRYCWYFLGVAALLMVVVNAVLLRSKPEDKGLAPWGETRPAGPAPVAALPSLKLFFSEIFNASRFWMIGASYFFISGALYIVTTFMVDYARYSLGFPYQTASLLATIHGLGQIPGVLSIPILSDYIGRRRTIFISNVIIAASIASVIAAGANAAWLFVSIGVFGAVFGVTFPMYGAIVGDYFRKEIMGTVIGFMTPFYALGAIVAHRLAGQVRDVTGSFTTPFSAALLAALAAAGLILLARHKDQ